MDFERKVELAALLAEQDRDVATMVAESELPAAVGEEPVEVQAPQTDRVKPDESALAAWVDDLREFERDHAGESAAVAAVDKLKSSLLDDLAASDRERMFGDRTAADEQEGVVADFHADLMMEGAALEVRDPEDPYLLPAAPREASYIDSDWGGGGGSGDGGSGGAPSDVPPPEPPPDPPKPDKKAVAKARPRRDDDGDR